MTTGPDAPRWEDVATDPNSAAARVHRRAQLEGALRVDDRSRIDIVRSLCEGRRVLDVGCVAHDLERMTSDKWLHRHVVDVAATCLGIDYDPVGVAGLVEQGYDCRVVDVTQGPEQVADRGPFDVVVAGEVIEHLACPQALFTFAASVLAPGGRLVITTPNPYAPWRARAGQIGYVHENVDHVLLAFPSGIIELGERTDLRLEWFTSVGGPPSSVKPVVDGMVRVARRKVGLAPPRTTSGGSASGAAPTGNEREHSSQAPWYFNYPSPWRLLTAGLRGSRGRIGETAIYVLVAPT
jgi:2-polyprenyl-3-methyl-5-hydroxy-6-metoxy-1,4-benzoquinol methylase